MKRCFALKLFLVCVLLGLTTQVVFSQTGEARLIISDIESDDTPKVRDADYPKLSLEVTPINESGVPIPALSVSDFNLHDWITSHEIYCLFGRSYGCFNADIEIVQRIIRLGR